jgi:transcriptional regulator with XRE-family HTH domain
MTESTIGSRIRGLRGRDLTQQQLADAAGVSVDLIRKLEQGARQTTSIPSLQRIARALDVDVAELVGKPRSLPSAGSAAGVVAIKRALTPVDDLLGDPVVDAEALTVREARHTVDYAWGAYWNGRYEELSTVLPCALPQLRATVRAAGPGERPKVCHLLARLHWVTACTLVHLGQTDSAYIAIRQALQAAANGDDELLSATLRGSVAWQLLVQGRCEEAYAVAVNAAEAIEPRGDVEPPQLSAYGSLLLTGATSAARGLRADDARHLLSVADEVARRMGGDRHDYETYFGPSQVVMQQVDVDVVTEEYAAALTAAERMPARTGLPRAARARHLTDQALAHCRLGHTDRALDALLVAERTGPDWIRYQTLPRAIVAELLYQDRGTRLRSLARRWGVRD